MGRIVQLETIGILLTSRAAGESGIVMLAFAPKFLPLLLLCVTLVLMETSAQIAILVGMLGQIGRASEDWTEVANSIGMVFVSQTVYNNFTSYMVSSRVSE